MIFLYLLKPNPKRTAMKRILLLVLLVFSTTYTFAQKKEKVKGTKILKTEQHEVDSFQEIEIEDNLEVFLIKGSKNALEIETDENLHTAIDYKTYGKTLRLTTNKDISSFKKLEVRVTYTDSLKMITVKHEAKLNAITELQSKNLTIKTFDYSKAFINVNTPNFTLISNDKSKIEMNLKSSDADIEMSKNSELKALITASKLKCDMYQKAEANLEGDVSDFKLRLDNNAKYTGKNFNSKFLTLTTEGYTNCSVYTNGNLSITALGKSEVSIFGDPKIEIKKFGDEAILMKKTK